MACNGTTYPNHEFRDILISEFMPGDADGGWLELENISDQPVNFEQWKLTDTASEQSYTFPDNNIIQPGEFLLLSFSNSDHPGSDADIGFELTSGNGLLRLEDARDNLIDTLSYHPRHFHSDLSIVRYKTGDRNNYFTIPTTQPTPGATNQLALWEPINFFNIDIEDPSGLALSTENDNLWTVSDISGSPSIFEITRSGEILRSVSFTSEDLEGITQDPSDHTLWVAEERRREIVQLRTSGTVLQRIQLDIPENELNSGLEGITINTNTGMMYTVNTKLPRLFIRLSPQGEMLDYTEINYGGAWDDRGFDLSGMFYDHQDDIIWMVSDEAASIFITDTRGNALAFFETGIEDMEGIAVDRENKLIFVVSDNLERLYHIAIPENLTYLTK